MKPKQDHKLVLELETIRVLESLDLELVRGGEGEGDELAMQDGGGLTEHTCAQVCA